MAGWDLHRIEGVFAEAAIDPSLWRRALDVVTAETDAVGAILLPIRSGALPNVPSTESMVPSLDTYFRDGWHLRDERANGIRTLLRTGVSDDFDAIDVDHMKRHPYYQEFLAPHGLRWFAAVRILCGEDLWVLSIQRSCKQEPFAPDEKRRLAKLSETLPSSVAIARAIGSASSLNALDAFEFNDAAAVLIDRYGKIIRANLSAERVLRGDVRICNGRIVCRDASASAALDQALHDILFRRDGAGLGRPVRLPRTGKRPLLAYPGRTSSMMANPLADCQAILILVDLDSAIAPQIVVLRHAFDLTDAEARIAALLSSGVSLEVVCDWHGIAKETARNHLKSIFAKTGTHRQAELVALLSHLPSCTETSRKEF